MKICIIGNGSLAMFTAARIIHTNPDCRLTIIGPKNRKNAASAAAGLMLNIFSEIDFISNEMPITKWKLRNWKEGLEKWNDFFSNRGLVLRRNIYSSFGTKIYFDKDTKNQLERKSFLKLAETAKIYNTLSEEKRENELFLPHEHSIDARFVLSLLDEFVIKNANYIDDFVEKIEQKTKNNLRVTLKSKAEKMHFDKVILAAGSKSSDILEKSYLTKHKIPYCLKGIGTALELFTELDYLEKLRTKSILRSPNRGGTCGIHMVQRSDSIYIGASSVVTNKDLDYPRLGSVETLIKGATHELKLGNIVRQSLRLLTGYRPISQDAVPVFGELEPNLFLCYGHKRDGFTWAPFLSEIINNWTLEKSNSQSFREYLDICNPLRDKFASFGDYEKSKELYLLNEEYSYAQHDEIFDEKTKKILNERFEKLHNTEEFKTSVCHPELVNINYYLAKN